VSARTQWQEIVRVAIAAWHTRLGLRRTGEQLAQYETAPADRIPFLQKLAYGLGAFVNNTLAAAIGGMLIILNLGFGVNPALVGLASSLPRITDALTDPLMGFVSDNARTRWGRRRPFIFVGAILAGLSFIALWWLPVGKTEMWYFWYFTIGSTLFYVGYTVFATPWVALGYELTPDYHERTRLMGVQNFIGQLAYLVSPWFLWIMTHKAWFATPAEGAKGLAIGVGVVAIGIGVLPAIFLRERLAPVVAASPAPAEARPAGRAVREGLGAFFKGFGATIRTRPFLKLCAATFLVFNGFIMIASFQSYVIIYYVFGGDQELGAKFAGYNGTLGAASTFVVITIVTWLATQVGKRKAFYFSTGMSVLGYGLKWFCYDPSRPWLVLLPAPLIAFGLGGLFTLMGSMIADVVDEDELTSHQRREGMFGSIFWWVVKVGMAAALAAGGFLLNATGFDVALGAAQTERTLFLLRVFDVVIPMLTSSLAIYMIASYPISEARAHDTRVELERRRGVTAAPAAATAS